MCSPTPALDSSPSPSTCQDRNPPVHTTPSNLFYSTYIWKLFLILITASDTITNGQSVGSYSYSLAFETQKHGMPIGQYEVGGGTSLLTIFFFLFILSVAVCAGDCSHSHPFSGVYDVQGVYFNVTKNPDTLFN